MVTVFDLPAALRSLARVKIIVVLFVNLGQSLKKAWPKETAHYVLNESLFLGRIFRLRVAACG